MAEEEVPWDDETDGFVTDIDETVTKSYGFSLRDLLLNPQNYVNDQKVKDGMQAVRAEVDGYFTNAMKGLEDEKKKLDQELESASLQYDKIDEAIHIKSANLKVPYVKPLYLNRNVASEETITIDTYDDSIDQMIGRMISVSNYVADVSSKYKDYNLGNWVFSGSQKNHILVISQPTSYIFTLEASNNTLDTLLDTVQEIVGK